jgi:hypothetical protein
VSAATKPPAAAAPASPRAAAAPGGTANLMIYGVNTDGAYWPPLFSADWQLSGLLVCLWL